MGDGSSQGSSRKRRGSARTANAGARARRPTETPSNVVPLPAGKPSLRRDHAALPKDHEAQIMLFTGVQIVRNGTEG